jgi:hypothetical protein
VDFKAKIHLSGRTATGIEVPEQVVEGLGGGKRPAVNVSINGYAYRSTVAPMGGDAQALRCFDGLSYSRKRRFTLPIEQAKTPETRARRIEKAVVDLRAQRV